MWCFCIWPSYLLPWPKEDGELFSFVYFIFICSVLDVFVCFIECYLSTGQVLHASGYLKTPANKILGTDWSQTSILVAPSVLIPPLMVSTDHITIFSCKDNTIKRLLSTQKIPLWITNTGKHHNKTQFWYQRWLHKNCKSNYQRWRGG